MAAMTAGAPAGRPVLAAAAAAAAAASACAREISMGRRGVGPAGACAGTGAVCAVGITGAWRAGGGRAGV
eukprot:15481841-Alexandrium_andersonii.AAC.1